MRTRIRCLTKRKSQHRGLHDTTLQFTPTQAASGDGHEHGTPHLAPALSPACPQPGGESLREEQAPHRWMSALLCPLPTPTADAHRQRPPPTPTTDAHHQRSPQTSIANAHRRRPLHCLWAVFLCLLEVLCLRLVSGGGFVGTFFCGDVVRDNISDSVASVGNITS